VGGEGECGVEMTQALYAHMNNKRKKKGSSSIELQAGPESKSLHSVVFDKCRSERCKTSAHFLDCPSSIRTDETK
jgi:hypothetical protein